MLMNLAEAVSTIQVPREVVAEMESFQQKGLGPEVFLPKGPVLLSALSRACTGMVPGVDSLTHSEERGWPGHKAAEALDSRPWMT